MHRGNRSRDNIITSGGIRSILVCLYSSLVLGAKWCWYSSLDATTRFRDEVLRIYQVLEAHLSGKHSCNAREYLAGPGSGKYSIVDINAWAWIRTYRSIGFSEDEIAAWPSLGQWVDRIAERPAVQRGLGEWYDEDVHPELVVRTEWVLGGVDTDRLPCSGNSVKGDHAFWDSS